MVAFTMGLFVLLAVLAAAFGLVSWAKRANGGDKAAIMGLYLLFGMPGGLLTIAGLAMAYRGYTIGWMVLAIGLGLSLPLLSVFRKAIAAISPMDPDSPIDWSGLAILLAVGAFLGTSLLLGQDPTDTATDAPTAADTVLSLLLNVLAFVSLAYVAVGYRNTRDGRAATRRLGLEMPGRMGIIVGIVGVIPAFICAIIGSVMVQQFQPEVADRLAETLDTMTTGVQNPAGAILLGLSAGIGEEIFIRGALQPRYGIALSSFFWMLLHTQYEATWVMLGLFLMGIVLGLIRKRYGTVPAILTHAIYNAVVVMIQVIAT